MIQTIKNILADISVLYKNFFHWNISKVLILITSISLWILLSLPFFIILAVVVFFDPIEWKDIVYNYYTTQTIGLSLMTALSSHLFYILIEWFLFILAAGFFMFWASYKTITMTKLNLDYLSGEPTLYFKNIYFNFWKIFKFLWIISWIWIILLIPFLIFIISFFIILFSFWWIDKVYALLQDGYLNMFSVLTLTSFFINLLVFIYLAYRSTFASILMLDEKNYPETQKSLYYVKESFKITSWLKIFSFLAVLIAFTLIMLPIDYLWKYLEGSSSLLQFLYWVIIFLLLNWIFEMLIVSVYKNIMLDKKEEIV